MAFSRRAAKSDIRNISPASLAPSRGAPVATGVESAPAIGTSPRIVATHDLKRELMRITVYSLPLLGVLVIATYLEARHGWVVPLAQRVLKLGA